MELKPRPLGRRCQRVALVSLGGESMRLVLQVLGKNQTGINCYPGMNCCCQVEKASPEYGGVVAAEFLVIQLLCNLGDPPSSSQLVLAHPSVFFFPGPTPHVAGSIKKPSMSTCYAPGPGLGARGIDTHIHCSIYLPDPALSISRALTHVRLSSIYRGGN